MEHATRVINTIRNQRANIDKDNMASAVLIFYI